MLPADESKPWMKYAGRIEAGDPRASRKIDDVVANSEPGAGASGASSQLCNNF